MCYIRSKPYISLFFTSISLNRASLYRFKNCRHDRRYKSDNGSTEEEVVTLNAIDSFTLKLVDDKVKEWSSKCTENSKFTAPSLLWRNIFKINLKPVCMKIDVSVCLHDMPQEQLVHLITTKLNESDANEIQRIISHCIKYNVVLNRDVMISALTEFARNGNTIMVKNLTKYYCSTISVESKKKFNLKYYLAIAEWMKGNVDKAMLIFIEVYRESSYMKSALRRILSFLIADAVENCSEASMITIQNHVMCILNDFHDCIPLLFFWKNCMTSIWFRDHQVAERLYDEHYVLRTIIDDVIVRLSWEMLKCYKEDAVVRLLQLLLKYDKKHQYSLASQTLFLYRLRQNNYNGCNKIIENCDYLGINLLSEKIMKKIELHKNATEKFDVSSKCFKLIF